MKYMEMQNVKVGMFLGEDVHDENGLLLYSKNTIITEKVLSKINSLELELLLIEDEETVKKIDHEEKKQIEMLLRETISNIKFCSKNYYSEIKDIVLSAVDKICSNDKALEILLGLKRIDNYTIMHSIRVGMLSAMIAKWQELDDKNIIECFYAGIFHQAGKIKVEKNILLKPGALTEEELQEARSYIKMSDIVLKDIDFINSNILMGIVQSTEKLDGSGYPEGFLGVSIHPIAKIVAVANIFDAATNDKSYKKAISLFEVTDILFEESLERLSPKSTTPLINAIKSSYMGAKVELSDGRIGEIIFLNKFDSKKLLVKVGDEVVNLSLHEDGIKIVRIIENSEC